MLTKIPIKEVMTKKVITITPDETVSNAAKLMKENKIKGIVVKKDNKPIGILTQKDLVFKIIGENKEYNTKISEIMTHKLIVCYEDDNLADASKKMYKHNITRTPVLDKHGNLIGIVTQRDMVRIYPNLLEILRQEFEKTRNDNEMHPNTNPISGECELCNNYSDNLNQINGNWVCSGCSD